MTNPELLRMETPLAERLQDVLNDAQNATEQFDKATWGLADRGLYESDSAPAEGYEVAAVAEAGISLGRAVQKLIAVLCEEAPEPQED